MLNVLYDQQCVICQSTRHMITAIDWFGRVNFMDIHDGAVATRFPQIDHAALMGQMHVIEDGGRVFAGFDGVRRLLRAVPLGWPVWLVLFLPGMGWLGPRVYRSIARNRYAINRLFGVHISDDCTDDMCRL